MAKATYILVDESPVRFCESCRPPPHLLVQSWPLATYCLQTLTLTLIEAMFGDGGEEEEAEDSTTLQAMG